MAEGSSTIANASTAVSVSGNSPNPPLPEETDRPQVYEEVRVVGVLGNSPTQTISERPRVPAPLPRDRALPISGYEAIRTTPATSIYTTPRTSTSTTPTVAQRQRTQAADETSRLVDRSPRQRQPQTPQQMSQLQEITAAFLALLGIGRWYAGVCVIIALLFDAGGSALIVVSIDKDLPTTKQVSIILCGTALILISLFWPLAWTCNKFERNRRRNFGVLFFYGWLVSLFYSGAVGALAVSISDEYQQPTEKLSFWVLIGMLIIPFTLAASILCIYMVCVVARRRRGACVMLLYNYAV